MKHITRCFIPGILVALMVLLHVSSTLAENEQPGIVTSLYGSTIYADQAIPNADEAWLDFLDEPTLEILRVYDLSIDAIQSTDADVSCTLDWLSGDVYCCTVYLGQSPDYLEDIYLFFTDQFEKPHMLTIANLPNIESYCFRVVLGTMDGYFHVSDVYGVNGGFGASSDAIVAASAPVSSISGSTINITNDVNVRSGPGLRYDTLTTLKKGVAVTYLGESSTDDRGVAWYKIQTGNRTGWVSSKYASLSGSSSSSGGSSSSTYTGSSTASSGTVSITGSVNVRSGPGLSYDTLTKLQKGDTAAYLGQSSTDDRGVVWYKIQTGSRTGWVSSKYASLSGSGGSYSGYSASASSGSSSGTVSITGSVNVRSGPGLGYGTLTTLKKGDTATYLGQSSTDDRGVVWYKIQTGGRTGWVSSKYSRLNGSTNSYSGYSSSGSSSSSSGTVTITGEVNVRSGPGLGYDTVAALKKGATATYLGQSSTDDRGVVWYKIQAGGRTGWVSSRYSTLSSTPTYSWSDEASEPYDYDPGTGLIGIDTTYNGSAQATTNDASEATLRQKMTEAAGTDAFRYFFYDDFDDNGTHEAFGVTESATTSWFVNADSAQKLDGTMGDGYAEVVGQSPYKYFYLNWNAGGSGSKSYLWYVKNGIPKKVPIKDLDSLHDFEGNSFRGTVNAFDMFSDGSGHTWKSYYYYFDMDSETLHEYGAITITRDQLLQFSGAKEILDSTTAEGWKIGEIFYRANGIINVNLSDSSGYSTMYGNLTLRYDASSVVDTDVNYGGKYVWAHNPEIATTPSGFVQPVKGVSVKSEATPAPEVQKYNTEAIELSGYFGTDIKNAAQVLDCAFDSYHWAEGLGAQYYGEKVSLVADDNYGLTVDDLWALQDYNGTLPDGSMVAEFDSNSGEYIGVWIETTTGNTYIDLTAGKIVMIEIAYPGYSIAGIKVGMTRDNVAEVMKGQKIISKWTSDNDYILGDWNVYSVDWKDKYPEFVISDENLTQKQKMRLRISVGFDDKDIVSGITAYWEHQPSDVNVSNAPSSTNNASISNSNIDMNIAPIEISGYYNSDIKTISKEFGCEFKYYVGEDGIGAVYERDGLYLCALDEIDVWGEDIWALSENNGVSLDGSMRAEIDPKTEAYVGVWTKTDAGEKYTDLTCGKIAEIVTTSDKYSIWGLRVGMSKSEVAKIMQGKKIFGGWTYDSDYELLDWDMYGDEYHSLPAFEVMEYYSEDIGMYKPLFVYVSFDENGYVVNLLYASFIS